MVATEKVISGKHLKEIMGLTDECLDFMKKWDDPSYRMMSRDTFMLVPFYEAVGEFKEGDQVVDWGCGAGRASLGLWNAGYNVTMVDFAPNCLEECVKEKLGESLRFIDHDLAKPTVIPSEYGFCVDLLQHIPDKQIDEVLKTIFESSRTVFLVIGNDGVLNKGYDFWLQKLCHHKVMVHRSMVIGGALMFFTSGYSGLLLGRNFKPNTDAETLQGYLRENAKSGKSLQVYPHQEAEVLFVCGGPSLNDYEDEIRAKREAGAKLVTVNGAYNWCIERDIKPSLQLVLDSQLHNKRFLEPVIDGCVYLVGSCVHPSLFEGLPEDRTFLWHVNVNDSFFSLYEELFGVPYVDWTPISGGSTVALRGLYTLKMLGLQGNPIDIYGLDSCVFGEGHHAYEQKENDLDGLANETVTLTLDQDGENEKSFAVHTWMIAQAKEFVIMKQTLLKEYDMRVHGPGLIAHLLETGAHLED